MCIESHFIYLNNNIPNMYRTVIEELIKWKKSSDRKPLIVKGVRQCGKTFILREFGRENYPNVAYFNFEEDRKLASLFETDLNPHRIIKDLCIQYDAEIDNDTLIIFDEIQFCGLALTSMKYFCEKAPEYHIICAGSLLGLMLSETSSFPVGKVSFLTMYPMTFKEFMIANGKEDLCEHIETGSADEIIPEIFLNTLNRLYREYCFVGGMPAVVGSWVSSHDQDAVRTKQSEIITSYQSDFSKHAPAYDIPKLNLIWSSIPEQLSKENRRFIFGHAVSGGRARSLEDALQWLIDAGMVIRVRMISRPSVPLSAYAEHNIFKLYYSDVGLLGAMSGLEASSIFSEDAMYREFKGSMTENYVLTELVASTGNIPFYWRSGNRAEVDFVIRIRGMNVPIEVKSGRASRVQSMERYMNEYGPEKAFVISEGNIRRGRLTFLPLPLTWNMERYLGE